MHYINMRKNEKQFLSLSSLQVSEFDTLLAAFSPCWERYYRYHTLKGHYRSIPAHQEHGNAKLKSTPQKLFFLLVYLKTNSLQEHQAASFGLSQSKVSRIAGVLLERLSESLTSLGLTPLRNAEDLSTHLKTHFNHVFTYDGLERGIQRNTDPLAQEEEFSGKKRTSPEKQSFM